MAKFRDSSTIVGILNDSINMVADNHFSVAQKIMDGMPLKYTIAFDETDIGQNYVDIVGTSAGYRIYGSVDFGGLENVVQQPLLSGVFETVKEVGWSPLSFTFCSDHYLGRPSLLFRPFRPLSKSQRSHLNFAPTLAI